jgi:hypothetical protein
VVVLSVGSYDPIGLPRSGGTRPPSERCSMSRSGSLKLGVDGSRFWCYSCVQASRRIYVVGVFYLAEVSMLFTGGVPPQRRRRILIF